MELPLLRFLIRATYDVLPTPHNLKKWKKAPEVLCKKCGEVGSLRHVLSACKVSLSSWLYTWRHDRVLTLLKDVLETEVQRRNAQPQSTGPSWTAIQFVRSGEGGSEKKTKACGGILAKASDWKLEVDLGERMVFPPEVAASELRPDLVVWSGGSRVVVLGELTVPWEENTEVAHEFKTRKYADLVACCETNGWETHFFTVEVGCRGFTTKSVWSFLGRLGMSCKVKRRAAVDISECATKASMWIWRKYQEHSRGVLQE